MKRVDLQKLCKVHMDPFTYNFAVNRIKDYGVKANLKSEALIDLLLDTQYGSKNARVSLLISTCGSELLQHHDVNPLRLTQQPSRRQAGFQTEGPYLRGSLAMRAPVEHLP